MMSLKTSLNAWKNSTQKLLAGEKFWTLWLVDLVSLIFLNLALNGLKWLETSQIQ